ncbi:MATE family efflux transporter, partial [Methanoregula sp.]|uniref:MATE family efflux transporter n=1 Tax=Methanoregula sp. TaxID=2052170 RepID=UPI0025D2DD7B
MDLLKKFERGSTCRSGTTENVDLLTGDPRKAIISLSVPMIVAMLLISSLTIVDAIWIVGLGSDALAAVGFMTPFFMVLMGLGTGIGAGATSAIARRIGAGERSGASNCAIHALLLSLVLTGVFTIPLFLFAEPLALLIGAGSISGLAAEYGRVLFGGFFFIIFVEIAYGVLQAEGDAKRTMYAMGIACLLNIVLDPILIYGAGLGIAGAAWGTVISLGVTSAILCYWFFIRGDTYVCLSRQNFTPDWSQVTDILNVGIPASIEFLLMSVLSIILNLMLVIVANTDAVAVFSVGFRVITYGIVPAIAIGTAVVSVTGAAYGAGQHGKIRIIHSYSILVGLVATVGICAITWIFAEPIASIFSYSQESAHLCPEIAAFIGVMVFYFPFVPLGIMSASVFQGVGKGSTSLFLTFMRDIAFALVFAYLFAFLLGMGERGIWWGIV